MIEKDSLKEAYLAVMKDIDNMIHRGLNKIETELGKGNKSEAYQSVLDTASIGNALFDLGVIYRAKFVHVGEEADEDE